MSVMGGGDLLGLDIVGIVGFVGESPCVVGYGMRETGGGRQLRYFGSSVF